MATLTDSVNLKPSNSSSALFRLWAQFVEDTLVTTGGWVVTSDTGQLTIASATAPAALNTKVGYRVYRMADTLQATKPVFLRIDYGSSAATNTPGMWLTIGEGSDGAGTITSIRYNGGASSTPNVSGTGNSASGSYNSYGSAGTNRVQIALFVGATAAQQCCFSLERMKDTAGADVGDGLIFIYQQVAAFVNNMRIILLSGGAQPPLEALSYILSMSNPSSFGSDVGVGIPIPMQGVAKPPGTGLVVVRSSDFIAEAQFAMTIYGVSRTYVQLNTLPAGIPASGATASDTTSRVCLRYD